MDPDSGSWIRPAHKRFKQIKRRISNRLQAKLLSKQREYVEQIAKEALTVAEPVLLAAEENIMHILEDNEEDQAESG